MLQTAVKPLKRLKKGLPDFTTATDSEVPPGLAVVEANLSEGGAGPSPVAAGSLVEALSMSRKAEFTYSLQKRTSKNLLF